MDYRIVKSVYVDIDDNIFDSIEVGTETRIGIIEKIYYHEPKKDGEKHYVDIMSKEGKSWRLFKFDLLIFDDWLHE